MLAPTFRRAAALFLGLSLVVSCDKAAKTSVEAPQSEPPASTVRTPDAQAPLPDVSDIRQLLPPSTQLLVEAKSLLRVAQLVGRDGLAKRFATQYAEAAAMSSQAFGVDLLDPGNLSAIGVDPGGPVGLAIVDIQKEAAVGWVRVSDHAKLRQTVLETAGRAKIEIQHTPLGEVDVFTERRGELALVLRQPYAIAVFVDRGEQGAVALANRIASSDLAHSLADSRGYRSSSGGFSGSDVSGFVNLAGMVESEIEQTRTAALNNWAAESLAEARASGASPERIAELEKQADEYAASNKRFQQRQAAQADLMSKVFVPFDAFGFRADAKPSAVVVEARASMPPDAFWRQALRNDDRQPALTWALDHPPLALVGGSVDVDVAWGFLVDVLAADGESWPEFRQQFRREIGVGLDSEIRPLLTGRAGAAVTVDGTFDFSADIDFSKMIGFAVHAEVSDAKQAGRLLAKAAKTIKVDGVSFSPHPASGGFELVLPDYRPIYLAMGGSDVVVSTDPELAKRLDSGAVGKVKRRTRPREGLAAMSLKGNALTFGADLGVLAGTMFGMMVGGTAVASAESSIEPGKPTRAEKRKRRELKKVEASLAQVRAKVSRLRNQSLWDAIQAYGITSMSAKEDERGFSFVGGQFFRVDSLAAVIEHSMGLAVDGPSGTKKAELVKLEQEESELMMRARNLRNELSQLRAAGK